MTRKDYKMIAEIIKNFDEVADAETRQVLVHNFIEVLMVDNPRFNANKFAEACGF
jgi:hypothetical protein